MRIKEFLEILENNNGSVLFESGGSEGSKVPEEFREGLKKAGISDEDYVWYYKPKDYDLIVLEKSNKKWAIAFFTEAEASEGEEEDIFAESVTKFGKISEAKIEYKVIDIIEGDFGEIVKICVEIASGKGYKGSFTKDGIKQLVAKQK